MALDKKKKWLIAGGVVAAIAVVGSALGGGKDEIDVGIPEKVVLTNFSANGTNKAMMEFAFLSGMDYVAAEGTLKVEYRQWHGAGVGDVVGGFTKELTLADFTKEAVATKFKQQVPVELERRINGVWLQCDNSFTPKSGGKVISWEDKFTHDSLTPVAKPSQPNPTPANTSTNDTHSTEARTPWGYQGPDFAALKAQILAAKDSIDKSVCRNHITQGKGSGFFTSEQVAELEQLLRSGSSPSPTPPPTAPTTQPSSLPRQTDPTPSNIETPPTKVETPQPPAVKEPKPQQPIPATPATKAQAVHEITLKDGTKLSLDFGCVPSTTTVLKVWLLNEIVWDGSRLVYVSVDVKFSGAQDGTFPKLSHPAVTRKDVHGTFVLTVDREKLSGTTVTFTLEK